MKTLPSALTPFVRSDAVGAILAETYLHPDQELTIAEVARRADVLPAVAHREIGRLVDAGVLVDRREGNNRLVRVNPEHPLYAPMREIIEATYGPVPVLRALLWDAAGVDEAYVYGSWAARRVGEPGPPPRDIDVLAVGTMSLDDVVAVQDAARQQLRIDVNVHRVTPESWARPEDNPFLATVRSRPLIALATKEIIHAQR